MPAATEGCYLIHIRGLLVSGTTHVQEEAAFPSLPPLQGLLAVPVQKSWSLSYSRSRHLPPL